jgi:hypothetical protein
VINHFPEHNCIYAIQLYAQNELVVDSEFSDPKCKESFEIQLFDEGSIIRYLYHLWRYLPFFYVQQKNSPHTTKVDGNDLFSDRIKMVCGSLTHNLLVLLDEVLGSYESGNAAGTTVVEVLAPQARTAKSPFAREDIRRWLAATSSDLSSEISSASETYEPDESDSDQSGSQSDSSLSGIG